MTTVSLNTGTGLTPAVIPPGHAAVLQVGDQFVALHQRNEVTITATALWMSNDYANRLRQYIELPAHQAGDLLVASNPGVPVPGWSGGTQGIWRIATSDHDTADWSTTSPTTRTDYTVAFTIQGHDPTNPLQAIAGPDGGLNTPTVGAFGPPYDTVTPGSLLLTWMFGVNQDGFTNEPQWAARTMTFAPATIPGFDDSKGAAFAGYDYVQYVNQAGVTAFPGTTVPYTSNAVNYPKFDKGRVLVRPAA